MVLPKANARRAYTNLMFTFGPRPESLTRERVEEVARECLGSNMKRGRVAFEMSEHGYAHVHLAVNFAKETKVPMRLVKQLKGLCVDTAKRKANCGTNYVPKEQCGKGGYEVLEKYLCDPAKIKECDDGSLELVQARSMTEKLLMMYQFSCAMDYYRKEGVMSRGWYNKAGHWRHESWE